MTVLLPTRLYVQNFAILVAVVAGATAVVSFIGGVRDEGGLSAALAGLASGIWLGFVLLPLLFLGWAVYLPLLASLTRRIGRGWEVRLIAVVLGPLNMSAVYIALRALRPEWEAVAYMISIGVVYGFFVRLPPQITGSRAFSR